MEPLTLHDLWTVTGVCICVLFLKQWKRHITNSTVFVSFLNLGPFYQHLLPLSYQWVRKNWKQKELWVTLTFPFLLWHFQCTYWLVHGSNMSKNIWLVSLGICFLEPHCFLLAFEASYCLTRKCGLSGLSVLTLFCWCNVPAYLPVLVLSLTDRITP